MKGQADVQFGLDIEDTARALAKSHGAKTVQFPELDLYCQLAKMPQWLDEVRTYCSDPDSSHSRAADWLLDNDYQILRAIRRVKEDLPENFFHRLPVFESMQKESVPRVYEVAHSLLDVTRLQLSLNTIVRYMLAYQEVSAFSIAELWALPSMLRLASLEILADAFQEINGELQPPFAPGRHAKDGQPIKSTDRISRVIVNLGALHSIVWDDFFDQTSRVEAILKDDPAKVYAQMDFDTRDSYRKIIEILAAGSKLSETAVAQKLVELSRMANGDRRRGHVGYWLFDGGRADLEKKLNYHKSVADIMRGALLRHANLIYTISLILAVLLALIIPGTHLAHSEAGPSAWIAGISLSLLPATVLSISIVHWLITIFIPSRRLPALDFRKGIPTTCRTAVVVPVIVSGTAEIQELVERLEIRHLANPDARLRYGLLSDLSDATVEHLPGDQSVKDALVLGIRKLNERYANAEGGPFFLMHRDRRYNSAENCWMGWERKRGKLEQFNKFLLGDDPDDFAICEGNVKILVKTRFVITLDADTMMPPDAAACLIGTLAHPLNAATFDPVSGRVISGYTILQPRIEILPSGSSETPFSYLSAGDTAIDIYTHATSDVYQDLFGTGIFVGKGIYDVSAFQRGMENRVPVNTILSHDLFEGLHCRAALVTNIVLFESFPSTYVEYALRLHRWFRGDWQLFPWLGRSVRSTDGECVQNTLSGLDRWKILDNLRRSLISPALFIFFIGGWVVLPGSPWLWTILALMAPGIYLISEGFTGLRHFLKRGFLADFIHRLKERGGRWFLAITFLVSDTLISLDAACRTLWRLFVSRRNLLEWRSAAHSTARVSGISTRIAAWRFMWPSSAISLLLAIYLALYDLQVLMPASPLLLIWFLAPEIATWTGRPREPRREKLNTEQSQFLMQIARRTWHYFETFAGPEDHWLPPDNFQVDPNGEIAHRTSPTNIGLFLVSALSARDFGFISTSDLVSRACHAFETFEHMETYRGHLLNWYDTRTLEPLEPRYISTVDSGNLAVCLLALKQGCLEIESKPIIDEKIWAGLSCTFDLLIASVRELSNSREDVLQQFEDSFRDKFLQAIHSPERWHAIFDELTNRHWPDLEQTIGEVVALSVPVSPRVLNDVHIWLERFDHHLNAMRRDLNTYMPWLAKLSAPPAGMGELSRDLSQILVPSASTAKAGINRENSLLVIQDTLALEGIGIECVQWLKDLKSSIRHGTKCQDSLRKSLLKIAADCQKMAFGMDFKLLYDLEVRLFHIGYNLSSGQLDASHYDLLATEARLASFFAIAKHDVPLQHWFFLERPVTRLRGKPSILSWNGSMFEYLMPPLFLPRKRDTLLGESESTAVEYQRQYAKDRGVPWGISESAFGVTDAEGHYQYRAFGAPGLGIRRGLTQDLVVSPYASALALCVWPNSAVKNLQRLQELGAVGTYGYMDALDFTPDRAPKKGGFVLVQTYMAHHQGMTIAAITNVLSNDLIVKRVLRDKSLRAIEVILQERIPRELPTENGRADEEWESHGSQRSVVDLVPWAPSSASTLPQMHLIGNGRMAMWISEAGGGGLFWKNMALTRWRPDPTRDRHGYWIYLRDVESGALWSVGRRPTGTMSDDARVIFHQHMVEMFRRDHDITVRMEVTVAPGDDVEIRRMILVNEGNTKRTIDLTSYAEVVLAPSLDDERHPAFSKLFVGSAYLPEYQGLLFSRRARRPEIQPPFLLHKLVTEDMDIKVADYETDREKFVGRDHSMRRPQGLVDGLSRTTGWTLDPIMSLQLCVHLKPMETKEFSFITIAGASRDAVLEIARRYDTPSFGLVFAEALRESARDVSRLELSPACLPEIQALASLLVQPSATLRVAPTAISANTHAQFELWRFGISGDLPILLVRMGDGQGSGLLDMLVRAQQLWRRSGMFMDIVVLRTGTASYDEPVRERVLSILRDAHAYGFLGRKGGIHLLSTSQMDERTRHAVEAAAHVVIDEGRGSLDDTLDRMLENRLLPPRFEPIVAVVHETITPLERPDNLAFDNEYGGFDTESGEYVIHLEPGAHTPSPWCNVLANGIFGSIVSEAGLGFSWAINSGENRLTPWSNDPVANTPGEIVYLRDETTAEVWTPTPAPLGHGADCQIWHGKGHSRWVQRSRALEQELLAFVPLDDPVKIVRLRLRNLSSHNRRITATYYAEWLLGALESIAKPHVACEYDAARHAILANNGWNSEFASRVAFLSASHPPHSVSGDRYDFLGKEGEGDSPAALRHRDLGGKFTPGGDACAAYQIHLDIGPDATEEVVFVLGQGADRSESEALIDRWSAKGHAEKALTNLQKFWKKQLDAVQVETPDLGFDLLINQWLPYQNLSSRLMARAGFYQAGGAFGYRDQLQDVLALMHGSPNRVREHILFAAQHQFDAGDALHWWHPPSGRGVRTRCSDDYLWLPYVTSKYVEATGDRQILDVDIPFLNGPELRSDEHDHYAHFDAGEASTLFEHCSRALDRMMVTGQHGLPLMGTGDWNDGMDRIGAGGEGESVWLAWFQIALVGQFAPLAAREGKTDRADRWGRYAQKLRTAIDKHAWDGEWFIRAFDDEGEPWGSHKNDECQIDSIVQSWSAISGSPPDERTIIALTSASNRLVNEKAGIVKLLDPPFHETVRDPGYIKAYPPGVRENGGQYTHAAAWLGLAFAKLEDGEMAFRIFDTINPIKRTSVKAGAEQYIREPYVLAGDVSALDTKSGRGGWSWYTGAAGWTWQLGVEGILGLQLKNGAVQIDPCLPKEWGTAKMVLKNDNGTISITIEDPEYAGRSVAWITVDGKRVSGRTARFPGPGRLRNIVVKLSKDV
jgi:cyclic beta-1,2-glucan glucanotransferase